jgi:preprotein translocase subunit SecY
MKKSWSAWRYLWKSEDIRRKLLITLGLLIIYRFAANVPVPGINTQVLQQFQAQLATSGGTFFQFLDLLSGGTVSNFSLLSMGVYPYITAQIILQLLIPIIPSLKQMMDDNPTEGRKWMEKWTLFLTIPMAALSAIGQINIFNSISIQNGFPAIVPFGFQSGEIVSSFAILLTMIAGTMFAIWLGELISEYGIRNQGLSLIIFAGIVAKIPSNFGRIFADKTYWPILLAIEVATFLVVIFAIVYVQQGRRYVPVMYPGRRVGNRMSMPVKGSFPLMVNMAGMIPLIFASAILQFPGIIAGYFQNSTNEAVALAARNVYTWFNGGSWGYWLVYFLMVVIFGFFYTAVLFEQQNYGENLKRMGAQIPGVNRGAPTQKYLSKVQNRITLVGAVFLGVVAVLPYILGQIIRLIIPNATNTSALFLTTSAGLLIVVGVVRDTFSNIDAELKLHGYQDSFLVK